MPVDRQHWTNPLFEDFVPHWPCPRCGATALSVIKPALHREESPDSPARRRGEEYDSAGEEGVFSCLLRCAGCEERLSVSGRYDVAVCDEPDHYEEAFAHRPASITPAPPVIRVPRACANNVRAEVQAAFSVFWSDKAACLNRIRQAIELVLNEMGVPRGKLVGKARKKVRRSLHDRILWLKGKRAKLAEMCDRLMAVKHLGNAGSHPDVVIEAADYSGPRKLDRPVSYRGGP